MKKNTKSKIITSSLVTSLTLGSIGSVTIALLNNINNKHINNQTFNTKKLIDNYSDLNKVLPSSFINSKNIIPLSSTKKGHALTPYGWLATYSESTKATLDSNEKTNYNNNTLVLIGWDGSILWVNNQDSIKIYSVKYNFKTNTIFVVRSQDPNGIGDDKSNNNNLSSSNNKVNLTIHDASSGKILFNSRDNSGNRDWSFVSNISNLTLNWGQENKRKNNLYYQDMITLQNGDILWYYLPNPLQINIDGNDFPKFKNYIEFLKQKRNDFNKLNFKIFIFKKDEIDNAINKDEKSIKPIDISSSILSPISGITDEDNLISAPFFVPYKNLNQFTIYFFKKKSNNSIQYYSRTFSYDDKNNKSKIDSNYVSTVKATINSKTKKNKMEIEDSLTFDNSWDNEYLNTNLLPTRNLFDESIITFAYPYASRSKNDKTKSLVKSEQKDINVPIFNVVQLDFSKDASGEGDGPKNVDFNFGSNLLRKWNKFLTENSSLNEGRWKNKKRIFWYPWPFGDKFYGDFAYSNQTYNRLISVSPFDGTIIYAARPNITKYDDNNHDLYNGRVQNKDKWASFWIGQTQGTEKSKITNFIIENNGANKISSKLINNINDIYENGFWFDPTSNTNLYFRTTGTEVNKKVNGNDVYSSPIGLINNPASSYKYDIYKNTFSGTSKDENKTILNIDDDSYINFITSRANLTHWYPNTWQDFTKGRNLYKNNEIVNTYNIDNDYISFDGKLHQQQKTNDFKSLKSIQLLSNWKISSKNKNRFIIENTKLQANQSDANNLTSSKLILKWQFNIKDLSKNTYIANEDKTQINNFNLVATNFEKELDEYSTSNWNDSWQFLTSWSKNVRFTNENNINSKIVFIGNKNYNANEFGNNNIGYYTNKWNNINNYDDEKNPLRVELEIDYDPNKLGDTNPYIKKIKEYDGGKFTKKYPISSKKNETIFQTIFQDYIDWKSTNISWDSKLKNDVSPGNISIKAYLSLNPNWKENGHDGELLISSLDGQTQVLVSKNWKAKYIYKDEYNESRYIYKQTSDKWNQNANYGFGANVKDDVKLSWKDDKTPTKNYVANINDENKIIDQFVRKSKDQNTNSIFKIIFENNKWILKAKNKEDAQWAKNRFTTFNQLLGRKVVFEYKTSNNEQWLETSNNTSLNDESFENVDFEKGYEISTKNNDHINQLRFKLVNIEENNDKLIVSTKAINDNNTKFISGEIASKVIKIMVDYNWFNDIVLTINSNDKKLNLATKEQIQNSLKEIENNVWTKSKLSEQLKANLSIHFSFDENNNYQDAETFSTSLETKLKNYNDQNTGGIVALYDKNKTGTNNVTKIFVKFVKKDNSNNVIEIVENNKENNNFVKQTANDYYINLKAYIDELKKFPLDFKSNGHHGTVENITIPKNKGSLGSSLFSGMDFDKIKQILEKYGITIQFKTKNDSKWKNNLNEIKDYDTSNPILKIKFIYKDNYKIKLSLDGTSFITNEQEIELKLNTKIIVKLNDDTFNNFKNKKPVTGNTYIINIDKNKENEFIENIKKFNVKNISNHPQEWNNLKNYLEIKYSLGAEKNFLDREQFISKYKSLVNHVQYNNQVTIKIELKNKNKCPFDLDVSTLQERILIEKDDSDFKIFILNEQYEEEMKNIQIKGTSANLEIVLPNKLNQIKNNQIKGLKIEFSLKPNISYDETNNSDINSGWVSDYPKSFSSQKILSIRIINSEDKYLYGNKKGNQAKDVHTFDLSKITQMIDVDKKWFDEIEISINGNNKKYLKDLEISDLERWENQIWNKSQAIKNNNEIKNDLMIKYKINNEAREYSAQELINKIRQMERNYNDSSLGIVQLWNGYIGTKIHAQFHKKNNSNIIFVFDLNNPTSINNDLSNIANTKKIKTLVDLSSYINKLRSQKIETIFDTKNFVIGSLISFNPPTMNKTNGFLSEKSYNEISSRLEAIGIKFIYNNGISEHNQNDWKEKRLINKYDKNKGLLYLRFDFANGLLKQNSNNIDLKIDDNGTINNGTRINQQKNIILTLDVPLEINVDNTKLEELKFIGNTKHISNIDTIKSKVNEFNQSTKQSNLSNVKNTLNQGLNDLDLEIRFSLNNLKLKDISTNSQNGVWFTIDELNEILTNSKINYDSNKVIAKFVAKNNPQINGFDKYHFSIKVPKVINEENKISKSNFNIFINSVDQITKEWMIKNLKLYGSQENFTLTNKEKWLKNIPNGLIAQYNVNPETNDKSKPNHSLWKNKFEDVKLIGASKDFWIRYEIGQAYILENNLLNDSNDHNHTEAVKIDGSNINVALKIKKEWLNQINLSGNLKDLKINEQKTIDQIKNSNMMPIENIIQIQYTFDDNEWLTKDLFINKLKEIDNNKTNNQWFILRENIKARFALNNQISNNKYVLDIDGLNIDNNNNNNPSINLITENLNQNVKGYINLDCFPEFQANNFKVVGSNLNAYLNIKDVNKLNEKLEQYSSTNIFSILYKWDESDSYNNDNKVWIPGQELKNKMLLKGNYEKRFFSIQFKIDNNNYELFKNGIKKNNNQYEIKTPDIEIQILIEIINPLINQTIAIKYLDKNNKPIFYNKEGGLQFTINNKTFKEFISSTNLLQDQKEALELVYYASQNVINEEQIKKEVLNPDKINTYIESNKKYNTWKTLDTDKNWSERNLNLKVNDYIIVALRIKYDKLASKTNPNGYVLKNDNHSPTNQNRVFGYKVKTNNIDVNWDSLKLRNVGLAENASYSLDGYAILDQIQLKNATDDDSNDDFLNVELNLDFFNNFHLNKNNQILVSASNDRLVKRDDTNVTSSGYYKDVNGNELVDKNNKKIPILYVDKDKGILAPPIKENNKTRSHKLVEKGNNLFTLELENIRNSALYSFFKNQDIAITFTNKKGEAINGLFDYYVDQENVSKAYKITNLIKFPIINDNLIQYKFNNDEFIKFIKNPNNLKQVYENSFDPSKKPINSQSKMIYTYKVIRQVNGEQNKTLNSIAEIIEQIKKDFDSKVKLKTTYTSINGSSQEIASNQLSSITTLQNGDRFKIEILSANENDLIFAQQPNPLIFTIDKLYEKDIEESILKFLRVEQKGQYEGQGIFKIYVDDPSTNKDDNIPIEKILHDCKFLIKVWNKDKKVKHNWTSDLNSISNLNNGDKVEWKLVSPKDAPFEKAYYNTIANMDKHDVNNNKYSYIQINKIGNNNTKIIQESIGTNPDNDNIYPEDSGFIIDGLIPKSKELIAQLSIEKFISIMNQMNFKYIGINKLGNIISNQDIRKINIGINEVLTLKDLIDQKIITFYKNNNKFNWTQILDKKGNWVSAPGNLENGDQITIRYQDSSMASYYEWKAPKVSSLKDKIDSMSFLTYVGIGVASIITLGVFGIVYMFARNKKIKKKK